MFNLSTWVLLLLGSLWLETVLSGYSTRTLVVMEDDFSKPQYSRFFKSLKQRGHHLDFKTSSDKNVQLQQYGVANYENIILMAPSASKIGESLSHKHFLEFLDRGGNILVALTGASSYSIHNNLEYLSKNVNSNKKPVISDLYYKMADKCGITIHTLESMVLNNFAHSNDNTNAVIYDSDVIVNNDDSNNENVLFNGIGMSIKSDAHLCHSLLRGDSFTYSTLKGKDGTSGGAPDKNIIASHNKLSLISSLQTRVNSRITFVGSMAMLSDEYYLSQNSNNAQFISQITKYTFGERGIIRATNATHYKIDDITINPNRYRIKDEIEFHITLEEFSSDCDCWVPFTEDDVQFEFIRLDPFIRQFMEHDGNGHYSIRFTIPDTFGVYKFTVNYQRRGWSHLFYEEIVSVRPFFHSEYDRFLPSATPYYFGAVTMIAGFMIFSLVFLFGVQGDKRVWQ